VACLSGILHMSKIVVRAHSDFGASFEVVESPSELLFSLATWRGAPMACSAALRAFLSQMFLACMCFIAQTRFWIQGNLLSREKGARYGSAP
jgi:hypothetical protein